MGGERGLKESLHPLTHPPHFFLSFFSFLFLFCLNFLRLAFFFPWPVSAEPFLNKAGRLAEKPCGDGEAALCRLNRAIVRHGGGEENGSRGTEGV